MRTLLLLPSEFSAKNLRMVVLATEMGAEYVAELVVGVLPSVV